MQNTHVASESGRTGVWAAWISVLYFLAYWTYLFFNQESEFQHYLTLVLLPLVVLFFAARQQRPLLRLSEALSMSGLKRGNLTRGLWWAALAGLALSLLQVHLSRYWVEVQAVFINGKWVFMVPLAFLLMFITAGFTEEFFFRGFLLGRLLDANLKSWLAVLLSAIAFALYHLPYAYFNSNWPSAGDWPQAITQSFVEALPIGILLGFAFLWSRRNLLACALLHALVNTLPAVALIKFGN